MTRLQILLVLFISALVLCAGVGAGAWYYLYGAPEMAAAQLVPANTLFFATIPNGAAVIEGYETSQAHQLLTSPNVKPIHDLLVQSLGDKNVDLIRTFLPNLSGQSFFAVTHFDPDHPDDIGMIAAMKPKAGLGDFGAFLDKLKDTYPELLKASTTGKGTVEGFGYDWLQEKGAPSKLCVADIRGWIVTTVGEASLQDWIERFEKRSTTSSLQDNPDYLTSVGRVGDDPVALAYLDYHGLIDLLEKQVGKTEPAVSDLLAKKLKDIGGAAIGTRFENGAIVDRFSFLLPRQAQLDAGLSADPCPFDTLKFTSRNTRFYWASTFNWKQYYANLKEQLEADPNAGPTTAATGFLQDWFHQEGIDVEHNIVEALGPEISVQAEWNEGSTIPEIGFFAKIDKPDDFLPVISALLDTARKEFATTAVVKEIALNNQNFATLNFVNPGLISPTVTEGGPYFGLFLTANQAVRSYQRDPTLTLAQNDSFKQQIGDQRSSAQQLIFLDSPYLLNRAYKTAVPYVSLAAAFNKDLAAALQGHPLPDDLNWLAPIGTWSCVLKNDDSGIEGYSVSGIGNQGILLGFAAGAGLAVAQNYGLLDKADSALMPMSPNVGAGNFNPAATAPPPPPNDQTNAPAAASAPAAAPDTNSAPHASPPSSPAIP